MRRQPIGLGFIPASAWRSGVLVLAAMVLAIAPGSARAQGEAPWWITASTGVGVYARIGTDNFLVDLLPAGLERDVYSSSLAVGRTLTANPKIFAWEAEVQAVKYFDRQRHWEWDGAILFRWKQNPWNDWLQTSLAIGDGLSYASQTPVIEAQRNAKTSKLLNFLVIEATVRLPGDAGAQLVLRLNHRSGIYGLFNGVHAGSNFVSLGVRMPFLP